MTFEGMLRKVEKFFRKNPDKEFHGMEVANELRLVFGFLVYPALHLLVRKRVLESREGRPLPERGGQPRVYYRLRGAAVTDRP